MICVCVCDLTFSVTVEQRGHRQRRAAPPRNGEVARRVRTIGELLVMFCNAEVVIFSISAAAAAAAAAEPATAAQRDVHRSAETTAGPLAHRARARESLQQERAPRRRAAHTHSHTHAAHAATAAQDHVLAAEVLREQRHG